MRVDQARIDAFARLSGDHQFLHVDPARARAEGPFGGTIAHGALTLSLMTGLAQVCLPDVEGQRAALNYGFDTVRFGTPVRTEAQIRAAFIVTEVMPRGRRDLMVRYGCTVEVENEKQPALTADWLILYRF